MKIITTQQILAVSGGCQKAADKYEMSTAFYQFVGTIAGIGIGKFVSESSTPLKILGAIGGYYIGSKVGYVFGAADYWVDRAVHKATDGLLKPAI